MAGNVLRWLAPIAQELARGASTSIAVLASSHSCPSCPECPSCAPHLSCGSAAGAKGAEGRAGGLGVVGLLVALILWTACWEAARWWCWRNRSVAWTTFAGKKGGRGIWLQDGSAK